MDLSLIIPTLGQSPETLSLLESLARQDLKGLSMELLVVEDGGTSPPLPALPFPVRVVRHEASRGRATACNAGARGASGRILLFLDDDLVLLRPDHLATHAASHDAGEAAVLGEVAVAPGLPSGPWSLFLEQDVARMNLLKRSKAALDPLLCETGNFSLPRETFLRIGGFDTAMRLYGCEDFELGLRLAKAGIPLRFRPDLKVLHHTDMVTLSAIARKSFGRGVNSVRVARVHPERSAALGVGPFPKALLHHLLYPVCLLLAYAGWAAGLPSVCVWACHRVAFTWRMQGIRKALR